MPLDKGSGEWGVGSGEWGMGSRGNGGVSVMSNGWRSQRIIVINRRKQQHRPLSISAF
ncbi:MAG: hypothetical protein DSM106950_31390 [Stigonema ocellatum SAG 48.90 = DSM 106950]|nr:hypothetical protein [Stigonema ocellatum SAG 48.90 = DSM 106950]